MAAFWHFALERIRNSEYKMKTTKVYLTSIDNVKDPQTFVSWKEFIPKERWEKTVRPLKEEGRKTELAAWLLLYHALKEWGISEERINADGAYCYGEHGKPMRSDGEVCFNISHSGKYVLCAVSETEIGCDIEKIKEVKWKLVKRFFSEEENDFLERLERQEETEETRKNIYTIEDAFTRLWVLRESYVKKTGEGLGIALSGLDFSDISDYNNIRACLKNDFNNLHTPICQTRSKGRKNGEFLKETFFEIEYDGYRIAICREKDSKVELAVCSDRVPWNY